MQQFNTNESRDYEAGLDDSLSDEDAELPNDDDDLHLKRIYEYRQDSLTHVNPLTACLGALNCDLMEFGLHSAKALKKSIAESSGSLYEQPEVMRMFGTHTTIVRQIDRFANLNMRITENERKAEKAASKRRSAAAFDPLAGFKH